ISCFDPVRREVAKLSLQMLLQEGKIHPAAIQECVTKAQKLLDDEIVSLGQVAAEKAQVPSLHKELLRLLGKLHFRNSLGQNVLSHSVEVSHIMGMIAAELRLNEALARRIGLLHDIG